MGLPSTSIEGFFRNSLEDVQKFLNTRHPTHYKVYNLCEEKPYPDNLFFKQGYFPFKDHEAPPLNIIRPFCEDAAKFLNSDPRKNRNINQLSSFIYEAILNCNSMLKVLWINEGGICILF